MSGDRVRQATNGHRGLAPLMVPKLFYTGQSVRPATYKRKRLRISQIGRYQTV
jgi:hypothetical protein